MLAMQSNKKDFQVWLDNKAQETQLMNWAVEWLNLYKLSLSVFLSLSLCLQLYKCEI